MNHARTGRAARAGRAGPWATTRPRPPGRPRAQPTPRPGTVAAVPASRWSEDRSRPRGADYQARFDRMAARGVDVHGEAALVESLLADRLTAGRRGRVLDAGCGTGRVAIELDRRGFDVVGADLDAAMLAEARRRAPHLRWHQVDLSDPGPEGGPDTGPGAGGVDDLGGGFDLVVLAGNVLIFVQPGTEAAVVAGCAARLRPGGLLVAGFQVRPGGYGPAGLDADAAGAGLSLVGRWDTWDRQPWSGGGYQVSVHRAPAVGTGGVIRYGRPHPIDTSGGHRVSNPDDMVSDETRAEEDKEAAEKPDPGRGPTTEEEAAADRSKDLDPGVAESEQEMNEKGANVKGEGEI